MVDDKTVDENLSIFIPQDEEKRKIFYEGMGWSEQEYNDAILSAVANLKLYPPTKDQEIMLSDIKLGDFATLHRNLKVHERLLACKVGNYSDLQKESEGPLFIVYMSYRNRIIHVSMARDNDGYSEKYILYWHSERGWIDLQDENWPLTIAHLDTAEHYRFAYDLFHDEGKHKNDYYADSLWRPPTTTDSIEPPTYWIQDQDDGDAEDEVDEEVDL
jgi:hypothetical protein